MEVFAAMVDRMDQGVGQVLAKLKSLGVDDNTLIVFISDNGAPAEDVAHFGQKTGRNSGPVGTAGSFESQGKNWSFVSNSPFRAFKNNMYEGGISSPFIAWFLAGSNRGRSQRGPATSSIWRLRFMKSPEQSTLLPLTEPRPISWPALAWRACCSTTAPSTPKGLSSGSAPVTGRCARANGNSFPATHSIVGSYMTSIKTVAKPPMWRNKTARWSTNCLPLTSSGRSRQA